VTRRSVDNHPPQATTDTHPDCPTTTTPPGDATNLTHLKPQQPAGGRKVAQCWKSPAARRNRSAPFDGWAM